MFVILPGVPFNLNICLPSQGFLDLITYLLIVQSLLPPTVLPRYYHYYHYRTYPQLSSRLSPISPGSLPVLAGLKRISHLFWTPPVLSPVPPPASSTLLERGAASQRPCNRQLRHAPVPLLTCRARIPTETVHTGHTGHTVHPPVHTATVYSAHTVR